MNRFFRSASVVLVLTIGAILPMELLWAATEVAPVAAKGPRAEFSVRSVDFGRVNPSDVKRHDFVITNVGDEPLLVTSVNPSCGCTTAGQWDREIAPGKSGRIPIEFNPANFSGVVTKAVTVSTNDRTQPTHVLELKAVVWRPFVVQPTFANFLPVEGEPAQETKVMRIRYDLDQPVELDAPQSSDPRFKTELKAVRPGKEFELHVTYDSATGAAAPSATITIKTSSRDQPQLTVTAFAMPQPAVVVLPATLRLPAAPMHQDYNHNIVIRSNGRTPLHVTEAAVEGGELAVRLTEMQPGKLFYLNVAVPRGFEAPAGQPVIVLVKTSHPRFPELRVPIVQEPAAWARPMSQPAAQK